jgi:hypothetical protein
MFVAAGQRSSLGGQGPLKAPVCHDNLNRTVLKIDIIELVDEIAHLQLGSMDVS